MTEKKEIKNIADYINAVSEIIEARINHGDYVIAYRGEPKAYSIPGKPGIFREDYLRKEEFFEKNLLDEMKANRITLGNTYLECAVDAQHDEFPSRLLDVTYNALVALYFAVTPYYKKYNEDEYDGKEDGSVIVYFLPNMYCAGANNLNEMFNNIIDRKDESLKTALIQKNYKLIDHIKMNARICVQQGAFILFQGDYYTPISQKDYEIITIKKENRKKIREELNLLFGINTGFIYPEPFNLYATMGSKAYRVVNTDIDSVTEAGCFLARLDGEIAYYYKLAIEKSPRDAVVQSVIEMEQRILEYKMELEDFCDKLPKDKIEPILTEFNERVRDFEFCFSTLDENITLSTDALIIDIGKYIGGE